MGDFFGDLERLAADLYPYRLPIGAGLIVVLAAIGAYAYRSGWHLVVWERRATAALIGTPALVVLVVAGWYLGSPLFINKTVDEELPFALAASDETTTAPPTDDAAPAETAGATSTATPTPTARPTPTPTAAPTPTPTVTRATTSTVTPKGHPESTASVTSTATPEPTPSATSTATPEPTPSAEAGAVKLKTGSFSDQDDFHRGSGQATIFRGPDGSLLLRLEDLNVTNGPDLHVILTPHEDPEDQADVKTQGYVDLGKLKGNRGNQNYPIPDDVDPAIQMSVVIYCAPFNVIFSVAQLQ